MTHADLSAKTRLELEAERDRALAQLERQRDLMAKVCHDLRSPMSVIMVASQMLRLPNLTCDRSEHNLRMIDDAANSMQTLLQDVLDVSKLERGSFELASQPFVLREFMESIVSGLALLAGKKGLELRHWIDPRCPGQLLGDPGRLRQVLGNLLNNAIKFTHSGSVEVKVSPAEAPETFLFEVTDTGVGIDPAACAHIFDPYRQAHGGVHRNYGGTGLGLSICRQIVALMGGEVGVTSQLGKGSTFFFTARLPVANRSSHSLTQDLTGVRVLLADEIEEERDKLEGLLRSLKMVPVVAPDGPAAVAALEEARLRGTPFPVAFLDLSLGEGDGFFVVEQLHPETRAQTRIVTTTTAGCRGDGARCQELGVAAYLTKPLAAIDLTGVCTLCLNRELPQGLITRHLLREAGITP